MPRHHFVPQFMLENWATNGRLTSYQWIADSPKKVVIGSPTVRGSCQIEDLYAFYGLSVPARNAPEDEFFTPRVDTPAAGALRLLRSSGVAALASRHREAWARFIVSFGVRTPETMRSMGPAEFRNAMEIARGTAQGPPELEAIVTGLIARNMHALERNMPLKIAMELATDPAKLNAVGAMQSWLRRFDKNKLLVSDRPLLAYPGTRYPCGIPLDNPDCLIALPIAPNMVFFASASRGIRAEIRRTVPSKIAHAINTESVMSCVDFVYASDDSLGQFVRSQLVKKAERSVNGISEGFRL
jgi:hypothetical protein